MRLPDGARAVIAMEKVERYLLDPTHPRGGVKARFFSARGFRLDRPAELAHALLLLASTGWVVETVRSPHGIKYVVDGTVSSPMGTEVSLRTVWIVPAEGGRPRLVTAYPGREARDDR